MAAINSAPRINLRRTFGSVAVLLVLGLLWLAFFGGGSPSSTEGQDFLGPSSSPLESTGIGFQPIDSAIISSISSAGVAKAGMLPGSGDNVAVLALAGGGAVAFSTLIIASTLKLRFGSFFLVRTHLRQITGA